MASFLKAARANFFPSMCGNWATRSTYWSMRQAYARSRAVPIEKVIEGRRDWRLMRVLAWLHSVSRVAGSCGGTSSTDRWLWKGADERREVECAFEIGFRGSALSVR